MSRFLLSRLVALGRVAQLPVVVPPLRPSITTLKPINVVRFLASWGPDKKPADRKEVELRIFKSVSSHDKVDQSQVKIETHLINDLGLDSLDHVEVIMAVEDEFGIEIDDVDSEKLFTVKDLVDYVVKLLDDTVDPRQNPGHKYKPTMDFGRG